MDDPALLITQCLQNDFVEPIGRYDPIPNRLHVGHTEALRLMCENPLEGPLARTMGWAYGVPDAPAVGDTLELLPGIEVPNICAFYERAVAELPRRPADQWYQSYVHGDLNGTNIILDSLENDLLCIFTPVADREELREACALTDALLAVPDLGAPFPATAPVDSPMFRRAWATVGMLRAFYPHLIHSARDPFQLWVGQLRYAAHTLGFDECDELQRRWALYTAGRCVERITRSLQRPTELRLDWLDDSWTRPGRVALTILPGRRDHGRSLDRDLDVIVGAGITRILCLASHEELERYGVRGLIRAYQGRGLAVFHLPVLDQRVPSTADMRAALDWVDEGLDAGEAVLIHCVGGLGRSGLAAAALLRTRGASSDEAVAEVRRARSPRAVETAEQEEFVRGFST
jgi:protein-tyrosine phosphatase